MSTLRERMHEATASARTDLDDLAFRARHTAVQIRRRRRTAAALVGVAAVAIAGSAGLALTRPDEGQRSTVMVQPAASPTPQGVDAVTALTRALDAVAPGGTTTVSDQVASTPGDDYAQVAWTPPSGGGPVYLQVNVQRDWSDAKNACASWMLVCTESTGRRGAMVTYSLPDKGPTSDFRTAVLLRKDRVRIVISQANGHSVKGQWKVTRGDLPLTDEQIKAMARDAIWDLVAGVNIVTGVRPETPSATMTPWNSPND